MGELSALDSPTAGSQERSSVAPSNAPEERRRSALLKGPQDGLKLDSDFEARCRLTVGLQRRAVATTALGAPKSLGGQAAQGVDSVMNRSPTRLQEYLAGEGAVYAQYDLSRSTYVGGALPDGWAAVRSRSTGRIYYANRQTGETQWDPPLYPIGPEWTAEHSPQTGAVFYVNRRTGKSQWERPVDELFLDIKASRGSDAEALEVWRERRGIHAEAGFAGLDMLRHKASFEALPAPVPEQAPDALMDGQT